MMRLSLLRVRRLSIRLLLFLLLALLWWLRWLCEGWLLLLLLRLGSWFRLQQRRCQRVRRLCLLLVSEFSLIDEVSVDECTHLSVLIMTDAEIAVR